MSVQPVRRTQSAALITRKLWHHDSLPPRPNVIAALPVSESRFIAEPSARRAQSTERRTTQSGVTSSIWRQVNGTRSELRLRSLRGSRAEDEPIRINLQEKVDRIRSKHEEREEVYRRQRALVKETINRIHARSHAGCEELHGKIVELLAPYEEARLLGQERYRARLMRLRNGK